MTFSGVLRGPFVAPIASPGIVTIPWWQPAGAPKPIAAYQAIDAASYAASKVNLANPGTYDLTDGTAYPTWAQLLGWRFVSTSSQFLRTGITPGQTYSMLVQYRDYRVGGGMAAGFDSGSNLRFYVWPTTAGSNQHTYGEGNYKIIAASKFCDNMGFTNQQGYLNGVADGTAIGAYSGNPTGQVLIGCGTATDSTTPSLFFNGTITAAIIWDMSVAAYIPTVAASMKVLGGFELKDVGTSGAALGTVLLPANYNAIAGAPLVMYHHGSGEDKNVLLTDSNKIGTVKALTAAGYIVAGLNPSGEDWGNDASIAGYNNFYDAIAAAYNVTRVCAWSQSMGGFSGLNCFANGHIPYKGWLGTYPACDLAWCYANGYVNDIEGAYGIMNPPNYATQTAGHDPILFSASTYDNLRMRFYASAADTAISKTANSDAMATLVTGHATEHDVVVCSGNHGDPSHFQPSDYVAFFNRCI